MIPSRFVHSEAALVKSLGLARKKISSLRGSGLVRGTDWANDGGEVRYSADGLARLLGLLGLEPSAPAELPPAEDLAPKDPAPSGAADAPRELVCVRTYPLNRRIVQARDGELLLRVRVRDSAHITPGMTLSCSHVSADLWELATRLPRWKGKW